MKRLPFVTALKTGSTRQEDFILPYVNDLRNVIDMEAIRGAGLKLGVDPLGGAALHYWEPIADIYGLNITVVNKKLDPTFGFMPVDHDGKIRMDCSSPYAMANLVKLKDQFRVAFGNDPDSDRHGIVTPSAGLMNPNHYLAVADPLSTGRTGPAGRKRRPSARRWSAARMIDRAVLDLGRRVTETPVGFKWFAPGLFDGSICFGGEESAGASFLRRDGTVWTTDKDGPIMDLLAAEITARTGKDPGEHYRELTARFGTSYYTRIDAPATPEQKALLGKTVAGGGEGGTHGRRADHGQTDAGARQRCPDRRPESRRRRAAGSRPGRPARKTSIRFTRRVSKTRRHLDAIVREAREIVSDRAREILIDPVRARVWNLRPRLRFGLVRRTLTRSASEGEGSKPAHIGRGDDTMTATPLRQRPAWKALEAHYGQVKDLTLRKLFADDPKRGERLTAEAVGVYLDYSKNRVTDETLRLLVRLADECGLRAAHRRHVPRRQDQRHRKTRRAAHGPPRPERRVHRRGRRERRARSPRRPRQDGRLLRPRTKRRLDGPYG